MTTLPNHTGTQRDFCLYAASTIELDILLTTAKKIWSDTRGLIHVAGLRFALRWLSMVAVKFTQCWRDRNLQPADQAMGNGPFDVRLRHIRSRIIGPRVTSGMREIWVRDVYTGGGFLEIHNGDMVVDLGANKGNFTALALGAGPKVQVICVEANRQCVANLERTVSVNHSEDRVRIVRQFIGGRSGFQTALQASTDGRDITYITEEKFVEQMGLQQIDFLKCDIEGSEYELLTRDSLLMAMTNQLAIELHPDEGDCKAFTVMLDQMGFQLQIDSQPPTYIVRARRPSARSA